MEGFCLPLLFLEKNAEILFVVLTLMLFCIAGYIFCRAATDNFFANLDKTLARSTNFSHCNS